MFIKLFIIPGEDYRREHPLLVQYIGVPGELINIIAGSGKFQSDLINTG